MNIVINPGSGPVADANDKDAWLNIFAFMDDLAIPGLSVMAFLPDDPKGAWRLTGREHVDDGRYGYRLELGERVCHVAMPGLPLERVRFMGAPQDPWQFPRLYVDGSSWLWCFALSCARSVLTDEQEG